MELNLVKLKESVYNKDVRKMTSYEKLATIILEDNIEQMETLFKGDAFLMKIRNKTMNTIKTISDDEKIMGLYDREEHLKKVEKSILHGLL